MLLGGLRYLLPVIKTAHEEGYYVITADYLPNNIAHKFSDEYCNVSIVDKDAVLKEAQRLDIDGIMSFACDPGVIAASYVQNKMSLPSFGPFESVEILQNKDKFRAFLAQNGFNVPQAAGFDNVEDAMAEYHSFVWPVIVKPTDRSGSRGIMKVSRPEDLPAAVEEAAGYSFENKAIIEDYIDGPEFSCECISRDGEHTMLAVTLKFTTGEPHYIETGHIEPAPLSEEAYDIIRRNVFRALTVLGIRNGASHSEFKYQDGEVKFIEIGEKAANNRDKNLQSRILSRGRLWLQTCTDMSCGCRCTQIPRRTCPGDI